MFELVRTRPLLQVTLALLGGAAGFVEIGCPAVWAGLSAMALCVVFRRWWPALLALLFCCAWEYADQRALADSHGQLRFMMNPVRVSGVADSLGSERSGHTEFTFTTDLGGQLLVVAPARTDVIPGDRLGIAGSVMLVSGSYWPRRGIHSRLYVQEMRRLEPASTWPFGWAHRARAAAEASYKRSLSPFEADLTAAMVFGDPSQVPARTRDAMKRSGVYHLLAASGLNVAIVAILASWLLATLRLARFVQLWAAIIIVIGYAVAVGGSPPVVRAAVSCVMFLGASAFRRQPDALTAVGGGALCQFLLAPVSVTEVSFLLSYMTAAALIVWSPAAFRWLFKRMPGKPQRLWRQALVAVLAGVATSTVASLASLPLIAYYFQEVPLLGLGANVLAVPAMTPVMWAGLVGPALPFVPGWERFWLAGVAAPCVNFIASVSAAFSHWRWATIWPGPFHPLWLWPYYLLLFGLAREHKRDVE